MKNLDVKIHSNFVISIKDLTGDVNISDKKWDDVISLISDNSECVFFYGIRLNYNEDLENTIGYLAEEILIGGDGKFSIILLRIKEVNVINRGLLNKLWKHYDSPGLVFLENIADQSLLVNTIKLNRYYDTLLNAVRGLSLLSQSFEQDVLWLRSNNQVMLERINHLYKEYLL